MSEQTPAQVERTEPPKDSPKNKPKKKCCKRVLCIGSAVVFIPIFGLLGALATGFGQRALIQLADRFIAPLSVGEVSGGLAEGLVLNNVAFRLDGVDTLVEEARLKFNFGCLMQRKICVEDITVNHPKVVVDTDKIPPSEEQKEDGGPMRRIELPIAVEVQNVALNDVDVSVDNMAIRLARFQSAVSLDNRNGLTLAPTLIDSLDFALATSAQPQADGQTQTAAGGQASVPADANVPPIENKAEEDAAKNRTAEARAKKETARPLDLRALEARLRKPVLSALAQMKAVELPFDMHVQDIQGKNWQYRDASQTVSIPKLQLQADVSGFEAKLQTLDIESSAGNIKGQGRLTLNNDFPLELRLDADIEPIKQEKNIILPKTSANLSLTGNLLKQTALSFAAKGGVDAQLKANAQLNTEKTPLNISLQSKRFQYPLSGEPLVKFSNLDLKLSGDLLNYHADLKGVFSNKNLALNSRLGLKDDVWNLPDLDLTYGENHITGKGNLNPDSQKLTLDIDIQAPDLSGLVPDLSANIIGKAKVSGQLIEPNIDVDLTANNLKFQDLQLQNLVISGKVTTDEIIRGDIAVDLASLTYGDGVSLHDLVLNFSGSEQKHELHLSSQGEPVAAELNIAGGFERTSQVWKGVLSDTNIQSLIGDLKNSQNVPVSYDNKTVQATVGPHCWLNPNLELCLPQQFKAGRSGEIPFEIKRLDLALVNEVTGQDNLLKGVLTSKGKAAWFTNKPAALDITVDGNNLALAQKLNGRNFNLPISRLGLSAKLENNNLNAKSAVQLQDRAALNADLGVQDIAKARKLSGKLTLSNLNLNIANQLLARNESVAGEVNANLSFAGDLNAPLLNGSFNVTRMRGKSASMPFDVKNGEVALRFNGNSSTLRGNIQSDEGRLDLDGDASWKDLNSWTGRVHAKTQDFKLDIPSMAKLRLTTDVTAKVTPRLLDLTGEVGIPWARIVVDSLPESAVSVSGDEVILDASNNNQTVATSMTQAHQRMKMAAEADGMRIVSDLRIKIGDDVTVDAYGLKSHLRGLLSVRQEKGQLGLYGQVDLYRGRFASFGQDLLIRKGQISFAGLPSQPFLNIEAIRNPEAMEDSSITAGVKVTGTADSPEVTVFSEPGMPQDQALSYILTGRSLENSGEAGSAGSVGAALLGMSLSRSGKAVGEIGKTFGISDLSLGTSGVGDSSKVTVSGNITDRLQIRYGVGLFDGLAEVTLRYRLLPRLFLQSVSGTNQAFDLLYQFQF